MNGELDNLGDAALAVIPNPVAVSVLEVDGKTFTADEIRRMSERDKNTLEDYRQKTERVKQDRETVEQEQHKLNTIRDALGRDILWYRTHSSDEWSGYTPEYDKVTGRVTNNVTVATDPGISALTAKINSMESELKQFRAEAAGDKADQTLALAESLIKGGKYPLADFQAVKDHMFVFFSQNGRIPQKEEVVKMVRDSHEGYAKVADRARKDAIPRGADENPLPAAGPAASSLPGNKENLPKLSDIGAVTELGNAFFGKQRALRGT